MVCVLVSVQTLNVEWNQQVATTSPKHHACMQHHNHASHSQDMTRTGGTSAGVWMRAKCCHAVNHSAHQQKQHQHCFEATPPLATEATTCCLLLWHNLPRFLPFRLAGVGRSNHNGDNNNSIKHSKKSRRQQPTLSLPLPLCCQSQLNLSSSAQLPGSSFGGFCGGFCCCCFEICCCCCSSGCLGLQRTALLACHWARDSPPGPGPGQASEQPGLCGLAPKPSRDPSCIGITPAAACWW